MAQLRGLDTSLMPTEMLVVAMETARDNQDRLTEVAMTTQVLLTIWPQIKSISYEIGFVDPGDLVTLLVTEMRSACPSTEDFVTLTTRVWPLASYLHCVRNVVNLRPLIDNRDYQQALLQGITIWNGVLDVPGEPVSFSEVQKYCGTLGTVWLMLDQILVHSTTKERAESLVESVMKPLLHTLIGESIFRQS